MKAPKRIVVLTPKEHRIIIQGLVEVRNELIREGKCFNIFDDLIVKISYYKRKSSIELMSTPTSVGVLIF